jgi:hypothetical protein
MKHESLVSRQKVVNPRAALLELLLWVIGDLLVSPFELRVHVMHLDFLCALFSRLDNTERHQQVLLQRCRNAAISSAIRVRSQETHSTWSTGKELRLGAILLLKAFAQFLVAWDMP